MFPRFGRGCTALMMALGLVLSSPVAGRAQQPEIPSPITFDQAYALANSRNRSLDAVRRRRAVREAAIRVAGQRPNPEVSAEFTRDAPHQAVNLGIPLDISGQRGRRLDLAREERSLADVDLQVGQRAVRRQLRETFYALIGADLRTALMGTVLDLARRIHDAAQARFEAGAVPRLEVLQADLGVARAQSDLDVARGTRAAAQAALNGVLDLPPDQPLALSGRLNDRTTAPNYDAARSMALASNPDLVVFDRAIAIEERRVSLLKSERLPAPVFSVGGVFNAPGEFGAGPRAGISIGVPLFSRSQGEIAASIAETARLRAEREATRRTIENAIYGAVTRVEAERRQVATYEDRLLPTANNLAALAEESYRAGRTSVLGVLDAQRNARDLSREALQAAVDLQFSLAELEELLGTPVP